MHAQLLLQCWKYTTVTVLLGGDQYSCTIHHIVHEHEVHVNVHVDVT